MSPAGPRHWGPPRTVFFPALGPTTRGAAAPPTRIRVYTCDAWVVLEAAGELEWAATGALRDLVHSTPSDWLVVDLRRVTYLDHNALAVLAHAHRVRRSRGGAVRLVQPPQSARTLLRLLRGPDVPAAFPTLEEALW